LAIEGKINAMLCEPERELRNRNRELKCCFWVFLLVLLDQPRKWRRILLGNYTPHTKTPKYRPLR